MSESDRKQFQHLSNEELIDFALEHIGEEHDALRQAALLEHWFRTENAPGTLAAPPGDIEIFKAKLSQLDPPAST